MKVTKNLTHIVTKVDFEAAKTEEELAAVFAEAGVQGFPAELDITERTEEHVQMLSLEDLLGFAKANGVAAVTYDVTYFPHADQKEVDYQVDQLAKDLDLSSDVIKSVCTASIAEYLESDAQRNVDLPVHSIVEAYVGGTAFAWYGINEYPRLKRILVRKLAEGGQQAKRSFILRASKAQVDTLEEF